MTTRIFLRGYSRWPICSFCSGSSCPTPMNPAAHWLFWNGIMQNHQLVCALLIISSARRKSLRGLTTQKLKQASQIYYFFSSIFQNIMLPEYVPRCLTLNFDVVYSNLL